ncbi:unnamed protein product [Nezara viridula]|uniref:Uncharacterized protein n=1 Tax=Nezara viridula TaxID=85310 RepID=A0A9P0EBD0_NEZVI|nr:unnamed protein product [Nezara viridula]
MDVGVDAEASLTWLKSGSIFPETEGFLFAIQEQVIATKAYRKHICGEGIDDLCRLCKKAVESIQHVTSGCTILAGKEYLQRHNNAAKVVHQAMAQKMELVDKYCPYYKYHPEPINSMRNIKVFWDQPILTDHTIPHNRPDILIIDKSKQSAFIIEIGVPSDDNLHKVVAEKKRKYVELAEEIKQLYHLKETRILPIVISCNGLIPEETVSSLRLLELPSQTIERMQQAADTDDYEDNLMIIGEAYECLRCIAESDEGKKALLDQGAVVKMADIYSLQSFQTDEALQILVALVQHFGPLAWDKENPRYFHSLMNKVALDFETDHSERKFELCGVLEALVISSDRKTIMSTYQEESWSTSVYKGLNDILTSKIGKAQRDPALKLAAAMIDLLGVEWTLTDNEKPKQFFLLLVHLGSVEVRMQLEDRNFEVILKNVDLITSCFIILELSVSYIANDSLDLEQKEKQQLYTALKGAFSAVIGTIKKYVSRISMNKQQSEEGKLFICALVRVLAAWLAQETTAMRNAVYELLPFILSVANDSFYSYRSHYVSEKVKSTALVSSGHSHQVDVLRVMLPALCHFTIEDKGRKIMLDSKEDEILLECFTFHWSIVNYKRPPIPKSERLKAKKEPLPELPASLIDEMNDSKAAMVIDTNNDVAPVLKENDVLTVCRKHMMMELGKRLFGD